MKDYLNFILKVIDTNKIKIIISLFFSCLIFILLYNFSIIKINITSGESLSRDLFLSSLYLMGFYTLSFILLSLIEKSFIHLKLFIFKPIRKYYIECYKLTKYSKKLYDLIQRKNNTYTITISELENMFFISIHKEVCDAVNKEQIKINEAFNLEIKNVDKDYLKWGLKLKMESMNEQEKINKSIEMKKAIIFKKSYKELADYDLLKLDPKNKNNIFTK